MANNGLPDQSDKLPSSQEGTGILNDAYGLISDLGNFFKKSSDSLSPLADAYMNYTTNKKATANAYSTTPLNDSGNTLLIIAGLAAAAVAVILVVKS
jgi:hypothetical protein